MWKEILELCDENKDGKITRLEWETGLVLRLLKQQSTFNPLKYVNDVYGHLHGMKEHINENFSEMLEVFVFLWRPATVVLQQQMNKMNIDGGWQ